MAVLNTYVVHGLNSLDAYTSHTLHEQDLVVVRHVITNYVHATAHVLYSMQRDMCVHCLWTTCEYLTKFL